MPAPAEAPPPAEKIPQRLAWLRSELAEAEAHAGRPPGTVRLLAITKGQPQQVVEAALEAGLSELGENYVQETAAKDGRLRASGLTSPGWHMVGHLQRNKVRAASQLFTEVETVDGLPLARLLSDARRGSSPLAVLCEVDFTGLPGRRGFSAEGIEEAAEELAAMGGLDLRGLMTVAAPGSDARRCFSACRELRDRLGARLGIGLGVLSMGMSEDFREAIAEGATEVRLGTLLFGPRA